MRMADCVRRARRDSISSGITTWQHADGLPSVHRLINVQPSDVGIVERHLCQRQGGKQHGEAESSENSMCDAHFGSEAAGNSSGNDPTPDGDAKSVRFNRHAPGETYPKWNAALQMPEVHDPSDLTMQGVSLAGF